MSDWEADRYRAVQASQRRYQIAALKQIARDWWTSLTMSARTTRDRARRLDPRTRQGPTLTHRHEREGRPLSRSPASRARQQATRSADSRVSKPQGQATTRCKHGRGTTTG